MRTYLASITVILLLTFGRPVCAYAQNLTGPQKTSTVTSVVGRLALEENHGAEPWLVLRAKNGTSYLIFGKKLADLRALLAKYGADNIVFLTGYVDGRSNISCGQDAVPAVDEKGREYKKMETTCIRYYLFDVRQVIYAKRSDEQMAPATRDAEQEKLVKESHPASVKPAPITGEISGTITALNLRSPIKTIEITDPSPDAVIKKVVVLLKPTTSVTRKGGAQGPLVVASTALKVGQSVSVSYTRKETVSTALAISILSE